MMTVQNNSYYDQIISSVPSSSFSFSQLFAKFNKKMCSKVKRHYSLYHACVSVSEEEFCDQCIYQKIQTFLQLKRVEFKKKKKLRTSTCVRCVSFKELHIFSVSLPFSLKLIPPTFCFANINVTLIKILKSEETIFLQETVSRKVLLLKFEQFS